MEEKSNNPMRAARTLIIGVIAVLLTLSLVLIIQAITQSGEPVDTGEVDVFANSTNECILCHREETPGIIKQYSQSTMAAAGVDCQNCHEVQQGYPGSVEHAGTYVLNSPTTTKCGTCHEKQVAEFNQSRHGLPAYVAVEGTQGLSQDLMAMYEQIPEGGYSPDKSRNAIAALEGEDLTGFTCNACHDIGKPAEDGSVGQCQMCHLRHEFSLEQVRKPDTCNYCHIGPDHPQYEIYTESPHGIAYHTMGHEWNWEAVPGTLTVEDFPAATCAICHISGFGATESSHDVGERLTWYLFAPISTRRPAWDENIGRMQGVCIECHNQNFIDDFYQSADLATERVNELVAESDQIYGELKDKKLVSDVPFDEPIDYEYFELWHHWGRTTKFGVWMQGPDYSQWHGAYEVLHSLAKLREMAAQKLAEAGLE
jgi:hydroxylamine dehydrogenase